MTFTIELTNEQERRLEEGALRHDAALVRQVLVQAVEPTVERLLKGCVQPTPEARRAILSELAASLSDAPTLSDDAVSRDGIYNSHP